MGVGHGDRVAWWGDTSLEAVPIFFALAKLGAVFAPVNARLGPDEAAEVVGYARPRLVVVDDAHADLVQEIDAPMATHAHLADAATHVSAADIDVPGLGERDPHVIFFTSGSTGRPKGVVLSHRANCLRSFPPLAADSDGGTVCMFPLFHMAGWSLALGGWQPAGRSTSCAHPTPTRCSARSSATATRIYLIPAVWARVLEHGVRRRPVGARRSRHRHVGHAARAPRGHPRRAPPHDHARVLRLDRGRCRDGARARRRAAQAGQRRAPPARRRRASRRRRGVRARASCSWTGTSTIPTPPPTRSARAGTTPVTSARSTTRATSRSSGGPAT